jgi:hypothetical protein
MASVTDFGVDLRCASRGPRMCRCQLLVGHEAGHATMAIVGEIRVIKTWSEARGECQEAADTACGYPWSPGFPSVAEDLALSEMNPSSTPPRRPGLRSANAPLHPVF